MKYLLILNDPAYRTERSYNGFRLAKSLAGGRTTTSASSSWATP